MDQTQSSQPDASRRAKQPSANLDMNRTGPFITEFQCEGAVNGIIRGKLLNVDDLWDRMTYTMASDECLEIVYRSIPTVKDSHPAIDRIWRIKDVFVVCIADDGDFQIRIPLYLHPYDFEFGFRAKDTSTNQWGPRSPTQRVTVPSFSEPDEYTVGEVVNFRNPTNCRVSEGTILEKSVDEIYKIQYPSCCTVTKQCDKSVILEVHSSKISRKGMENSTTIQIEDDSLMIRDLLIRRKDTKSIAIFEAIMSDFEIEAQLYCIDHYERDQLMDHWESMALFCTKNVFEFLFPPQFQYKVHCLGDGTHGVLALSNLRIKDMEQDVEMLKNAKLRGEKEFEIRVDSFDTEHIRYGCDCCRDLMTEWDYVYSCKAENWDERHDFCLLCVNTVVQLNGQMAELLGSILKESLNGDCIQSLVDFVVGRVLCIESASGNDSKQERRSKRELCDAMLPVAKRRRLD